MSKIVHSLRVTLSLCIGVFALSASALPGGSAKALANAQACQYTLGFAAMHQLIPTIVGPCAGNVTYDATGNGMQATANGFLLWRKVDNWTGFTNGMMTWVNTAQGVQSRLETQRFMWEPNPDDLPRADARTGPLTQTYLDDRSNAYALMLSFANAINRKEYVRAYSYWEPNAAQLQEFVEFQQGYASTQSVRISFGTVLAGAAAGNLYDAVPTTLIARTTQGETQTFAGCYLLHLGQPANQGVPPFQPLAIQSATVRQVANDADLETLMAQACKEQGGTALPPQLPANPDNVSANRYLDDRSTAHELMRSLVNALNRHEYLRAYAYWEPQATQLPAFDSFQQGYANTESVQLKVGTIRSDAGAGQLYHQVPVALVAKTTGGETQYFAGCYVLHLSQPAIQGTPPFQPLAIRSATVRQVNSMPTVAQINQSCQ